MYFLSFFLSAGINTIGQMLREILWLESGDTIIIRETGMQIQYNCVTTNQRLFLDDVFQLFYAYEYTFCTTMESLTP